MTPEWRRSLLAGLCFGLGAAACGVDVSVGGSGGATGEGWESFAVFAGASGLLVGTLLWRSLVARQPRPSWRRGAAVGALVGVVAHPVCWYLVSLWTYVEVTSGRLPESVAGPPIGPLMGLLAAFPFSAMSLLLIGWVTTPLAAMIGGGLAALARRMDGGEPAPPGPRADWPKADG